MSKWNKLEVKLESVQEYVNGLGVLELCEKYEICKSTMYNWVSQYKDIVHYPNVGYRIKRVHDLDEHIKKLNEQIHILQELSFFKEYSNTKKQKSLIQ
jgi:transposase-like protein